MVVLFTLLSQPLIFGGEARTASPVILFLNYVLVKFAFDCIKKINTKKNILVKDNASLIRFYNSNFYFLLTFLPFIILFFFFISRILNDYRYLKKNNVINIICPEGYQSKKIVFNSDSGFFINSANEKKLPEQKDFSLYLNYMADIAVIHNKFGMEMSLLGLSEDETLERDKFKFLSSIFNLIDTRLLVFTERQDRLLGVLGNQYLNEGGFFINPIDLTSGKKEGIIILKKNMVNRGFNKLDTCL